MKTIEEINEKIRQGDAVIVRADEMPELFEDDPKRTVREVDIVTTGTFGAMCSSGVFLNFGHSDPPIMMHRVWLNDVEAYTGIAAVDAYLGATQLNEDRGFEYGGGHVIEDLVSGKEINLRATSYGTDCYPRKKVETILTIDDLNQAIMVNPRSCCQKYNAAINPTDTILHTYMGTLLPKRRNINFSGTGEISPLINDPEFETIGVGTKIFLCGAQGLIVGEGTQHSPKTGFSTIATKGDLKEMSPEFLSGATIPGYGVSLFVGIGIPIPILNEKIAEKTAIRNKDIKTEILDYGTPSREKPVIKEVTYEELFSGEVYIDDKKVRTSPLSSLKVSFEIMDRLKKWIQEGKFFLSNKIQALPKDTEFKSMNLKKLVPKIGEIMTKKVITANLEDSIEDVSSLLVKKEIDQIPIVNEENKLVGIVTSWDITKAIARHKKKLKEIMTKDVITSREDEYIDVVTRKLDKFKIGSTPVVDNENKLIGIITVTDIIRRGVRK